MPPRLLTEAAAAAYLSLRAKDMAQVTVGRVTVAGRLRFDRAALDRWLDGEPAAALPAPANANASPASQALARFVQGHPDVTRRASR